MLLPNWPPARRTYAAEGVLARPPRPETGTGSGGANYLEYTAIAVILWK